MEGRIVQKDCIVIEYRSNKQLNQELDSTVRQSLTDLTIQIESNSNCWVTYGRMPGQNDEERNKANYRIKNPVESISLNRDIPHLESLTLEFLGLNKIPESVAHFKNLKSLNISFNLIDLEKEIKLLYKLDHLEKLFIFGLNATDSSINDLKQRLKNTRVFHTQEEHMNYIKEKREKLGN